MMNIEPVKNIKDKTPVMDDLDFDFKPITSGLGFHHQKATEVKPAFTEKTVAVSSLSQSSITPKKEMNVYQNDLSLFYGNSPEVELPKIPNPIEKKQKHYRLATKGQRVLAYFSDLFLVLSITAIVMTVMARTISMDLITAWEQYPSEITPLVLSLFCGFYLIYFSIFEKAKQSTLGKSLLGLRVMGLDNETLSLNALLVRATVTLLNFISLGLFSYFDLQNKVTNSKVIRVD